MDGNEFMNSWTRTAQCGNTIGIATTTVYKDMLPVLLSTCLDTSHYSQLKASLECTDCRLIKDMLKQRIIAWDNAKDAALHLLKIFRVDPVDKLFAVFLCTSPNLRGYLVPGLGRRRQWE